MYTLKVGNSRSADYMSVQEALNAVPYGIPATIFVEEGVYREKIFSDKNDLRMIGKGNVCITNSDAASEMTGQGMKRGTFRSYTAFFSGEKLYLENIRIANAAGEGHDVGQAVALYLDVDRAYLKNVSLYGRQDTLFLAPLPEKERELNGFYGPRCFLKRKMDFNIIDSSYIEGSVDFIFGSGNCLFRNCEISSAGKGFVCAPSGHKDDIGLVFQKCRFTSCGCGEENAFLMRPWREEGKAAFIECGFGKHINRCGLSHFNNHEEDMQTCSFSLFGCTFEGCEDIEAKHYISKEDSERLAASIEDRFADFF